MNSNLMRVAAISILIVICSNLSVWSQSGFDTTAYANYLETNRDLTYSEMNALYPGGTYYRDMQIHARSENYNYFDSIMIPFELTADEIALLEQNKFMVTERLSYTTVLHALDTIYSLDLPVFISTDCILEAIHRSYDLILQSLEKNVLIPNLKEALKLMTENMNQLQNKYGGNVNLHDALCDADLYVTVANSLMDHTTHEATIVNQERIDSVLTEIYREDMVVRPLFSERSRMLDFSQFTPRGHYINKRSNDEFEEYFRAMMWLGRIDFFLTPPPVGPGEPPWSRDEIRRMHLGSYLLQELLENSGALDLLEENYRIIRFMVGESDNLTPWEYRDLIQSVPDVESAVSLLSDETYDQYYEVISKSLLGEQKILSSLFKSNSSDPKSIELPVSYRILGQQFIIDSYVLSKVVFDQIIFQGRKIKRMMPNPLDAMFVLGNNNAGELMKEEIETYHYASQLDALRYLTDAYDQDFWTQSMYNLWLNSLRSLNTAPSDKKAHYFMNTVAWQQQKLNTQLASWAQLRHDNLLYSKQSYTSIPVCSFPHGFVEPYPEFYRKISEFSKTAKTFFSDMQKASWLASYFNDVDSIMEQLAVIAEKELKLEPVNTKEKEFLKSMLHAPNYYIGGFYNGWFIKLYFGSSNGTIWLPDWKTNYIVADVHTQPADEAGNLVGKVLHVGTGKVNLGVFLIDYPSDNNVPTAYVGPFQSYYEHTTLNFDRKTDEWWTEYIEPFFPQRPDWTSVYLLNNEGTIVSEGKELEGSVYTSVVYPKLNKDKSVLVSLYPNPVSNNLNLKFSLQDNAYINVQLLDVSGRQIKSLASEYILAGEHIVTRSVQELSPGIYYLMISTGSTKDYLKFIKL